MYKDQASPELTVMQNGVRVITDYMPQIDSIVLSIWVNAGGRSEEKQHCGIAHFLEHMAFKGTKTRNALDIAKAFDDIGGHFNAYTSKEVTVYYAKVLKEDFVKALSIITDILLNPQFDPIEMDKEREVILQEIAQTDDDPDEKLFDKHIETAYPDQPFGRSILGTKELVSTFQRDTLCDFIDKHYHGKNMLLSVAGNIQHTEVVNSANYLFSSLESDSIITSSDTAQYKGGVYLEERSLEQVHLSLSFNSVSYHDDDYYPMQILALILGGGMSSRLFQEVREKRGLAYSISAFNKSYSDCGMLNIYSGTSTDKVRELLDTVIQEIKKVAEGITLEELNRAKAQVKSSLLMSRESNYSRADIAGGSYIKYNKYMSKEEILERINVVSVGKLQDLMRSILRLQHPITMSAIGPIKNIPSYDYISGQLI